jgi:uncharacterized protein YacL
MPEDSFQHYNEDHQGDIHQNHRDINQGVPGQEFIRMRAFRHYFIVVSLLLIPPIYFEVVVQLFSRIGFFIYRHMPSFMIVLIMGVIELLLLSSITLMVVGLMTYWKKILKGCRNRPTFIRRFSCFS